MPHTLAGSAEQWDRGRRAQTEGSAKTMQRPREGLVFSRNLFQDRGLIISLSLPPYTEAAIPLHLRGPHFGSALCPLPFEVGPLPSTHRKVTAKGNFKARLCDKPRAEAYPEKRLSLPNPLTFILASRTLRTLGARRLEKNPVLISTAPSWFHHQIKKSK